MHHRAFTLIELLVVVSIIVVLIALLMPSMDVAIYHAEMTADAANMKGVTTAVSVYATDQKRFYPYREFADTRAMNLGGPGRDTRPRLIPYLSLNKNLIDPFCAKVDLSLQGSPTDSIITYSSYWMWFGWRLDDRYPGMKKLGDRMNWVDSTGKLHIFDTLITDAQAIATAGLWTQSTHPDRDYRLTNPPIQNTLHVWGTATYSFWSGDVRPRMIMDWNFLHSDGSATRMDNLIYDGTTQQHDDRLQPIPERINDSDPDLRNFLPK